ncbi:MAG TPA: recombinase family protein [Clostridium sp.]
MATKTFAYVRVSSKDQNIGRQIYAIDEYCKINKVKIDERDIYIDKISGKDFNRESYQALKLVLREGDTLIVKELDRLGRNMNMIKEEWQSLIKKGINIIVIDTPFLNTIEKTDLEKNLISNIVFELLTYLAEKERVKLKQRQAEGIAVAKTNGKHLGRPRADFPDGFEKVYNEWKDGKITAVYAFTSLKVPKSTYYKLVRIYEKKIPIL